MKKLIYLGCLLVSLLIIGCKKHDLTDPEQFMYGKWKITRIDTCSKDGGCVTVLENKGIFYFHDDLTCDVKYTGLKPFGFGKTFYWTRTSTYSDDFEMYNDTYIYPTEMEVTAEDNIVLLITQKNVSGIMYNVELTRM